MFLLCISILIILVVQNTYVVAGAKYGLMLWYQNVLPLLLPFMIISNLLLLQAQKKKGNNSPCAFYILLLGLLCGYPLGAKIAADFTKSKLIDKSLANRLLPLCNNISPMFLCGYIYHIILEGRVLLPSIILVIYIPYIIVFLFSLFTYRKTTEKGIIHFTDTAITAESILLQSIHQITIVGVYIMLCSIAVALLWQMPCISLSYKAFFASIIEITQGTNRLTTLTLHPGIKTALILGATSFGGISALFQTYQVTRKSGLSMFYYTVIKIVCGVMTGFLSYLLLI